MRFNSYKESLIQQELIFGLKKLGVNKIINRFSIFYCCVTGKDKRKLD